LRLTVGTYGPQAWQLELDDNFKVVESCPLPVSNASYICSSDCGNYLYTITESGNDSWLTSFPSHGPFVPVSRVKCEAPDPCYIVYRQGFLYTADYSGGSVSVYRTDDGKIGEMVQRVLFEGDGPHPRKQKSSHVHMLRIQGDTMYATDLGADRVHVLTVLPDGKLEHKEDLVLPGGSGPRHLDVSADGRFVYVLTEMSKELFVFDNSKEMRFPVQALKLGDPSLEFQNGGDIHLHPNGMFLYVSLRDGDDSVISFYIKPQSGTLTRRQTLSVGAHPRNFVILEDKNLMAVFCKNAKKIQFYPIDGKTGIIGGLKAEVSLPSEKVDPVYGVFE